jgi:hypothetical protein
MATKQSLTADRARELLDYDHETGTITWRVAKGWVRQGAVSGCSHPMGYVLIKVDGKRYLAHRLAWLIATGSWPIEHIDHINGDTGDNRLANLRDVSRSINQQNRRIPGANNSSGFLGVSWDSHRGYFVARIFSQGKDLRLGCFTDPAEAHQAYLTAKRQHHAGNTL